MLNLKFIVMKISGITKFIRGMFSRSGRAASKLNKLKSVVTGSSWYKKLVSSKPVKSVSKWFTKTGKALKQKMGKVSKFIKKHKLAAAGVGGGLIGGALTAAFATMMHQDEQQSTIVYNDDGERAPGETEEVIQKRIQARHAKATQYMRAYIRVLSDIVDNYEAQAGACRYFAPDYDQTLAAEAAELFGKACVLDDTDYLVNVNSKVNTCARIVQCGLNIDDQARNTLSEITSDSSVFSDINIALADVDFYLEHSKMFY